MISTLGQRWIVLVALVPSLLTPASAGESFGPVQVLEHFQPLRQPDPTSCGPTCAAMVLHYYGRDETAAWAELRDICSRVALMSPRELGRLLSGQGVDATLRRGELADLTAAIDDDRPVIVLVRIGSLMWHYVVVIGHRDGGAEFLLADPLGRHTWVSAGVLARSWSFDGDLEGRLINGPPCEGSGQSPDAVRQAMGGLGLTPHLMVLPVRPPSRYSAALPSGFPVAA